MILVRSRRLLLNGSKLLAILLFFCFITSCSKIFGPRPPKEVPPPVEKPVEPEEPEKEEVEKPVEAPVNNIALLLPFQLDRVQGQPSVEDVKRAEIPLDFYQGFKMALDKLAEKGTNFRLTVLDTRDNVNQNQAIGKSPAIQSADLVIGPIFPKEIPAFAAASDLGYTLQVSPLAATLPSQFNVNNLVSLVPSIDQHAAGLAVHLAKVVKGGDQVIVYNTEDEESLKFLGPLKVDLNKQAIGFTEIDDLADVDSLLHAEGKNFFITAAINRYAIMPILTKLMTLKDEGGFTIQLIGHPTWSKLSLDNMNVALKALHTQITTSYYVDADNDKVREFQKNYYSMYKIEPSEFAYKGYDSGYFFGQLLEEYGSEYPDFLLKKNYKGLQTDYIFEKNPNWGYVNEFIRMLQFDGYHYKPIR